MPAQLPRKLAPGRPDFLTTIQPDDVLRAARRSHQNCPADLVRNAQSLLGEQLVQARQVVHWRLADHVVERQHRVRLAAAEVGLQLNDRIAGLARQPLRRALQQPAQAVRQIGPAEELPRIAVLVGRAAVVHLGEVGGELGLLELAGRDVLVRFHHVPPRQQARDRLGRDRRDVALALLRPGQLAILRAQDRIAHLADFLGALAGAHRLEQAPH